MPSFGPHSKANHADEQQALTREHHFSAVSHYLPAITESLAHYHQDRRRTQYSSKSAGIVKKDGLRPIPSMLT